MGHVPQRHQAGNGLSLGLCRRGIFVFSFPSLMIEGDGLYRRFNRVGGFIKTDWYRFHQDAIHLQRAEEFDFVG
ncbi:MAG: hypothetical protein NPIRA03_31770 [Nitrospirales bacterium]|nr:MAG: hypothetical protein NPIRA03_31770 [Nitrospirales bacterium]